MARGRRGRKLMQYNIDELKKKIEDKKVWFCPRPFDHIYNNTDGLYAVCCIGEGIGVHSAKIHPLDWMNSDTMNELRYDMLTENGGDSPLTNRLCRQCKYSEKQYGTSERMRFCYTQNGTFSPNLDDILKQAIDTVATGEWKPIGRVVYVQLRHFGNQCNLDCFMCHPRNSSTRIRQDEIHDTAKMLRFDPQNYDMTSDFSKLNERILELAPYIKNWSVQGGEPLIMRNQYKVLDSLIETGHSHEISLEMNTNATVLASGKHRILPYFEKFKNVFINLSIDSVGEYNDYIRRRSKWNDIEDNIRILKDIPNVKLEVLCVMTLLSVLRFDKLLKWGIDNDILIKTVVVNGPPELHPRHLPSSVKKELIDKYSDSIKSQDYLEVLVGALSLSGDKTMFDKAVAYCEAQDRSYNFNMDVHKLFPELDVPYYE